MEQILAEGNFTGCAAEQTEAYIAEVRAVLAENSALLGEGAAAEITV